MSYTEFEDRLLVACFLTAEATGSDVISLREVISHYKLTSSEQYINRAVIGFYKSNYTGHSPWVGDPNDQKIEISARGAKEAEKLISLGVELGDSKGFVNYEADKQAIEELRGVLDEISAELQNNSVTAELGDKKEAVEAEIDTAIRIVSGRRFSLKPLKSFLMPVLKFLADKFVGVGLGELAKKAISYIVGFS